MMNTSKIIWSFAKNYQEYQCIRLPRKRLILTLVAAFPVKKESISMKYSFVKLKNKKTKWYIPVLSITYFQEIEN